MSVFSPLEKAEDPSPRSRECCSPCPCLAGNTAQPHSLSCCYFSLLCWLGALAG